MNSSISANRKAWTTALRSGNYNQRTILLTNKTRTAHCVWGVACEVMNCKPYVNNLGEVLGYHDPDNEEIARSIAPPAAVTTAMGLSYSTAMQLTNMNDDYVSFSALADVIDSLPLPQE